MSTTPHVAPQALTTLELFVGLTPSAINNVADAARVRRLPKDVWVFNQGDPGVRAHAVLEGGVRISQSGSDGAQVVVRFIGSGEMFGTVSLFTDGLYPADAVTVEETLEVSWSEAELVRLMTSHPQIAINVIRTIGKRLQDVQNRVRELATQRAERRVAHAVLRLAEQTGHRTTNGIAISFPLRRKDVADISGTTVHTASRILAAWEKEGLLISLNRHLTIRNHTEIRRISEDTTQ